MEALHATDPVLLGAAVLALLGIGSSLLAKRFGAPLLLVFLGIGIFLGPEGLGLGIQMPTVFLIGSAALAIILFDGGLRTRIDPIRHALAPALWLATLGVAVTTILTAVAASSLFALGWKEALLLGAVLASTDAAAVFFLLRAAGLSLPRRVHGVLEVESGSNDPMAVFLTVVLCGWIALGELEGGAWALAWRLVVQIGLGTVIGILGGRLITRGLNRLALPEGLHPILALGGAVAIFATANLLGGSGFLAVYLAGLWVGNHPVRAIANVTAVQDAATWLAQAVMFILLGVLVRPSELGAIMQPALLLAGVLMLIARPAAVWLCLVPFGFRKREIAFVGWVGLRGAVGIFLASLPLLLDLPDAGRYFNVAFVVVAASLLVQGWTLKPAAHWLQVALPRRKIRTRRIELDLPGQLEMEIVGYKVGNHSAILGSAASLPGWARPAMVVREDRILLPNEAGNYHPGDTAYFLAPPGEVYRLDWLFAEGDEAEEHAREMFGSFTLPGDVPLGDLADFYGLPIPEKFRGHTAAALFASRYDNAARIGDRVPLIGATLVVRKVKDDIPVEVGLLFETSPSGWMAAWVLPVWKAWQKLFP